MLAADMTRYEEIFAAVRAVKGMKLRGTSNEWLATAIGSGRSGQVAWGQPLATWLYALAHNKVIG